MDALALTPRQLAALKARRDLATFSRVMYSPYKHAPHIGLMQNALMQVARYIETDGREGIGRLIIEAPPRHSKSVTTARLFPAWALGRLPALRVIIASHTASLSEGHSRSVRNTLRSAGYSSIFPRTRLAEDSQAKDQWDLADPHEGGLLAVGTGGAVVGRGGGLIIGDDFFSSREQYESKAQRDKLWSWFTDELMTRQAPVAAVVLIGSRWGIDDIQGRALLQDPDGWQVIRLPALAVEDPPDLLGRKPGQALWPAMFSREKLLSMRVTMGSFSFDALYQQSPTAGDGGMFAREKLKIVDAPPAPIVERVRFWDLAISEKARADYTVGLKMGRTDDNNYLVEDVIRKQLSWKKVCDLIAKTAIADGPLVKIGIEDVLFSVAAVVELLSKPELHGYSIIGIPTGGKDKTTRAMPLSARCEAGMVSILRAGWNADYVDELAAFPVGRKDDQVDGSSGAYSMFNQPSPVLVGFKNNPFWGNERAFFSEVAMKQSATKQRLPAMQDVTVIHVAQLATLLKWPDRPATSVTVPLDWSPAFDPTRKALGKLTLIRVKTGEIYARCNRCGQYASDLHASANFNLICESCKQQESQ